MNLRVDGKTSVIASGTLPAEVRGSPATVVAQPLPPLVTTTHAPSLWQRLLNGVRRLVGLPAMTANDVLAASAPSRAMIVDHTRTPEEARLAWRNWPNTVRWSPGAIVSAGSTADVVSAVEDAVARGVKVKVVGSGMSWTGVTGSTDGATLVHLKGLASIESIVPTADGRVHATIGAGVTLSALNDALWDRGYVVQNLGTITRQTLGGVVATNTHGTGIDKGGFVTQVVGVEVVDGTGKVHQASATTNRELFDAVRSGLGLAGIVTRVTLDVLPRFHVACSERTVPLATVTDQTKLDTLLQTHEWLQFSLLPYSKRVFMVSADRTSAEANTGGDNFVRCIALRYGEPAIADVAKTIPRLAPTLARVNAALLPNREVVARPYHVLTHETRPDGDALQNVELFFPAEHTAEIVAELDRMLDRGLADSTYRNHFPLLVRFMRGDDTMLTYAPGGDRRLGCITMFYEPEAAPVGDFFGAVRKACDAVLARHGKADQLTVHLGKQLDGFAPSEVRGRTPGLARFARALETYDPHGTFRNDFSREWLGL